MSKDRLSKLKSLAASHEQLIVLSIFLLSGILFYADMLSCWFIEDDVRALNFAARPFREILFSKFYSSIFYTPLVGLSLKPDVLLFKMDTVPYHVHNVVILCLIAFVVYRILRTKTSVFAAFLSGLMVLFSAPSLASVAFITLRQYSYAILFSLLAIYLFCEHNPDIRKSPLIVFVIAMLAELSFLGKEQFMVLPFVFLVFAEGGPRDRIKKTLPFFVLLILHFLLRLAVLKNLGGYSGQSFHPPLYASTIVSSIFSQSRILFGFSWLIILVAAPAFFSPLYGLRAILTWVSALSISFLTMSSAPEGVGYRYWFISTVLVALFAGYNTIFLKNRIFRALFLFVMAALFFYTTLTGTARLKAFLMKESGIAGNVARVMTQEKYEGGLVLWPTFGLLVNRFNIDNLGKALREIAGIATYEVTFAPQELIASYPFLADQFKAIYAIKETGIETVPKDLTSTLEPDSPRVMQAPPGLKILSGNRPHVLLDCPGTYPDVMFWFIRRIDNDYITGHYIVSRTEFLRLAGKLEPLPTKLRAANTLSHHDKKWLVDGTELPDGGWIVAMSCTDGIGRTTLFTSELLFITPK